MEYQIPLARGIFGVLPTKQIRGGSTPLNGSNFSRPMELGWRPPKALCGSSILPRESRYAAQARIAGQALGKDEMQGSIPWCGSNFPISIAGDAAVLYTDDTAFDSPTGLQFCRESIDGDAPDSYPG